MAEEVIKKCSIISGAPDDDVGFICSHIDRESFIIAADSGYLKCLQSGIKPDVIIGDFDSSESPVTDAKVITLQVEKEHTDTFAAVRYAVSLGYNDITLYGAIGSRIDHTYSNILCLDYCLKHSAKCRIVNAKNRISLIVEEARINHDYKWFSLFAFLGDCRGVKISGAHYTAGFYGEDELDFKVSDQFGQSNFVEGEFATVRCEEGVLILIESND